MNSPGGNDWGNLYAGFGTAYDEVSLCFLA